MLVKVLSKPKLGRAPEWGHHQLAVPSQSLIAVTFAGLDLLNVGYFANRKQGHSRFLFLVSSVAARIPRQQPLNSLESIHTQLQNQNMPASFLV